MHRSSLIVTVRVMPGNYETIEEYFQRWVKSHEAKLEVERVNKLLVRFGMPINLGPFFGQEVGRFHLMISIVSVERAMHGVEGGDDVS